MPASNFRDTEFLARLRQIVEEQLSNEQFGVSELADKIGMSRSNLLRKVSKASGLSVSQFIRNIRLEHAAEMLKTETYTVSEISYKVGFGSVSYFIKCFREHFGYPPGSMPESSTTEEIEEESDPEPVKKKKLPVLPVTLFFLALIIVAVIFVFQRNTKNKLPPKSIAVLPFINDSNDSTNIYIINGIMESTLNKLQAVEDLRVISRTSVEKYRMQPKTIPEIAKELNVGYVVEGSGQKIGDRILLNIQLIEATSDSYIWSRQYEREISDIFALQSEIAKNITDEIEVILTPEEQERMEKAPTENVAAYDEFLKGLDLLRILQPENLWAAIGHFHKAFELDENFARAYAGTAMAFYFLEANKTLREYTDSINYYADQALFHDSKLPQSLIAKALFYMAHSEYELAVPYFEKALDYNPNYDLVLYFMVDLYAKYIPDTEKYLEYALRGLQVDPAAFDSITNGVNYLHISNALVQAGFKEQALKYVNKSMEYWSGNLYSEYLKAYIIFAENGDLNQLRKSLTAALEKDTNRLDIAQELAKICYFQRDYQAAYDYYQHYLTIKKAAGLDIYPQEDIKIAYTCLQLGKKEEAEKFLEAFKNYTDNDDSIYKNLNLCMYYAATGDPKKAYSYLELFSHEEQFYYWTIPFIQLDPALDDVRKERGYRRTFSRLETNFNNFHERLKATLKEMYLI
ncbi:helix-turn-helix domain-containing protein [Maribellus sediminis]|uniref:helix-turn-helix domain-containing protein n=1 Tax=Maribellus sediminis TaxID=2696285 RepID=UPI0014314F03|nr:helix-turn-helix domain-containing protein [Maribellus sediminis]